MKVQLLNRPTLMFTDLAIGECYDKGIYSDPEKRDNRIKKVALKHKHSSVLEFTNFVFQIEACTKVLLEMTRHRHANYACKSTRYTLNKGEIEFDLTGNKDADEALRILKFTINRLTKEGVSNEITSLMLPQAYIYRWTVQFNARSLMNFLELRRAKSAHFKIREVAEEMFESIPDEMKYIFKGE